MAREDDEDRKRSKKSLKPMYRCTECTFTSHARQNFDLKKRFSKIDGSKNKPALIYTICKSRNCLATVA